MWVNRSVVLLADDLSLPMTSYKLKKVFSTDGILFK